VNTIAIRLWDTKAGYHSITCGEGLERKMMYFQYIGVGAAPTLRSTQLIMGEQVANNREQQNLLYLKEVDGSWYLLEEPKGSGLIKKEYIPMGNRLVYPKKWSREKAVEVFLNHMIEQQHKIIKNANEWINIVGQLADRENIRK
jgi:hypothetical protein